jgi:hypothetical protein
MQTYEFVFDCEQCAKEIAEIVTSPKILTREELNQLRFCVTCKRPKLRTGISGSASLAQRRSMPTGLRYGRRADRPSSATSGIQLVQPESRLPIALVGCRSQQDARLVTILSHSMAPSETIRQG